MTPSGRPEVAVAELEGPAPWRSPVPFLWLAVAVLLTGAVAALLTGVADPSESDDARARIVAAAGEATVRDFAFSTVIAGAESDEPGLTAEGRYDADTQRVHAYASEVGRPGVRMEIIVAGRVQYMRFDEGSAFAGATGGKPWGRAELPERATPTTSTGPTAFTEDPLGRFAELGQLRGPIVRVGEERVRGVDTVHFRTTIEKAGAPVAVDLWIDGNDRFRRFRQAADVGDTRVTTTLEVFEIGEPVSIDLPPEDQVGPLEPALS